VFRLQTTQDYKINLAGVLYMVITILLQHSKIVSHAHLMLAKYVQIAAPARAVLVIKIKIIHEYCLTALALLISIQIFHNHLTANVSYCINKHKSIYTQLVHQNVLRV
jgi:hypothetical protein